MVVRLFSGLVRFDWCFALALFFMSELSYCLFYFEHSEILPHAIPRVSATNGSIDISFDFRISIIWNLSIRKVGGRQFNVHRFI